jgi:VanZ family protein
MGGEYFEGPQTLVLIPRAQPPLEPVPAPRRCNQTMDKVSSMDRAVCREYPETQTKKFLPLRHGKPLLIVLAAVSVLALLVATLWPLNPNRRNEVSWLDGEDGVRFGENGTIFSAAEFPRDPGAENESFSLELSVAPALTRDSKVICAFYVPENPGQFMVRQDEADITVVHRSRGGKRNLRALIAGQVMERGKLTLVTVTAGPDGTTVYINGKAKRSSRVFGLTRKDLTGELVVGNSPVENDSWPGILRGLAIYKNELSAREVANHFSAWRANQGVALDRETMLAMYRFRERSGNMVKNDIQPGIDLYIPRHFKIWRQSLMTAPWKEFKPNAVYAKDVIVNVLGFVPLGLVLFPYFEIVRNSRRPWLMSYLSGTLLSLTIEILQSFLPTRYSGWTDVITNSTGTALGAGFYLTTMGRTILSRLFGEKEAGPGAQRASAE